MDIQVDKISRQLDELKELELELESKTTKHKLFPNELTVNVDLLGSNMVTIEIKL